MTYREIRFEGSAEEISQQWHEQRTKGIGGSDVGIIIGVNHCVELRDLWAEKRGMRDPEDISHKPAVMVGNALEPVLRDEYRRTHPDVWVSDPDCMMQDVERPWRQASLDGIIRNEDGTREVLEIKTVGERSAFRWNDGNVPPSYVCQVCHYLAVTGFERAQVYALIGNSAIIQRTVERDERLIADIEAKVDSFWRCFVQAGKMPPAEVQAGRGFRKRLMAVCRDPLDVPAL